MGTTLTGNKIKDTYKSLIKVTDNLEASTSGKQLSDGNGNDFGLFVDTDGVVGIGAAANFSLDISSKTDGVALPIGTTANRATGSAGIIRYNSTLSKLEYFDSDYQQIASESYVSTQINNLIDSAPSTLDTLNEIAQALNDDADFYTTITNLIDKKQNKSEPHSATAQTFTVTVASKTSAHRYNGTGSSNAYVIDGVQAPYITITAGNTYKFDQSDSSNATHPLAFYYEADKTTAYTAGVTTNGTAGSSGAYTQIIATDSTPTVLHYQCSSHAYMGNTVNFDTRNLTGFDTDDLTEGTNLYYTDTRFDTRLGNKSIGDLSDVNLTGVANNKILKYDSSTSKFIIADDASASGGDTYDLNATTDGSNVDLNLTSTSGSDNSVVQLTAGSNITLTRNSANEVTIAASSGGGGGSTTLVVETFSGDNSDNTFTMSNTIASKNNLQIYIDGVYQSKSSYEISGQVITFGTAPATGTNNIEVTHAVALGGTPDIEIDTFSGDNSDTTFTLATEPATKNHLQIYIDGVYQSKSNYSTSGTTLTFTTAPATGTNNIEVTHIKLS